MAQIIGLPKLSPTMEEGVLVKWVKHEGDRVQPGDLVAEVETDKANMDFNLEDEGVLLKLLVKEGDTVKLGAPVAILGEEGEDISALERQAASGAPASAEPARAEGAKAPAAEAKAPQAPGGVTAREMADKEAMDKRPAEAQATPEATQAAARAAEPGKAAPGEKPKAAAAPAPGAETGGRILASPLAKTLAIELGIDLRSIKGTGPGGRIVERDVRDAAGAAPPVREAAPAEARPAAPAPGVAREEEQRALAVIEAQEPVRAARPLAAGEDFHDEPLSSMRKRIAQRLTEVKRDAPHFYLTRSFDAAPLMAFRQRLNELLGDRGKISVNDLIIKGVALALRRMPACNAAFMGDAIRTFDRVHIGVAVALEQGLVTPVIRDADLKGIGVIAAEVRDLAERARDRRLKVDEIQGSTFTVSNLGMFGIEHFTAILNPPEAGILAVGTVMEQPIVQDGQVAIGKRITMTMSCDHRVIDGALGARFLKELVDLLEKPESLAL